LGIITVEYLDQIIPVNARANPLIKKKHYN
jgi:hypothetical protein